ncbi:protein translocase subunit SecD [Candidatus Roizmanbacteria bacterium]|nr:protein translocase subunit SecD [Candidatus Roizmanbacteria bacterium]
MERPHKILIIVFLLTLIAIGVSIPEGYQVKFDIGPLHVDRTFYPLRLDIQNEKVQIRKVPRTVLGLDLAGGARLVYEADMSQIPPADKQSALDGARNIIEQRVNLFGVSEPLVQTSKVGSSERIIVEMPGVTEVASAKALIGQTAQLAFREFPEDLAASESATLFPMFENTKETSLTGKELKRASVVFDPNTGQPTVSLEFTPDGAKLFEEITTRNVGKNLPVFLDQFPITSPRVNEPISGGQAVISGGFTNDQAKALAIQLNSGALPVPIRVIEEKTVGPSLGAESVEKSIRAGLIGLGMVMLFMIAYYGRLGLLADVALVIYGLITYAIFRLGPITLTLPGIAGFILSIGMAVDSNILIFERIKEEARSGKPWQAAIEVGFGRAWDSIRDANVTTLLTCFVLFNPFNWEFLPQFGLARGFALTLAIGIFVSLFTGIVVSRNLIRVFIKRSE